MAVEHASAEVTEVDARPEGPPRPRAGYVTGFVLEGERTSLRTLIVDVARSTELIRTLARKDFFVRYRRASFGVLWAMVIPLLQALMLALIFSRIVRFSDVSPYAVYVYSGMVAWAFFNASLSAGSTSIVDASTLSTKIYFPRAVLPLVTVTAQVYTFVPNAIALLVLSLAMGVDPGPQSLLVVPAILLLVPLAASFALVTSALHVYFRDTRYLVQAALLIWFYATPVIYPLDRTGSLRPYIQVNPMTGVVELLHAATVGAGPGLGVSVAWTGGWLIVLAGAAMLLHRRFDRVFVDLL